MNAVITGRQLGYKNHNSYAYTLCLLCGKPRFVQLYKGKVPSRMCRQCNYKFGHKFAGTHTMLLPKLLQPLTARCDKCGGNVFTKTIDNDEICMFCGRVQYLS